MEKEYTQQQIEVFENACPRILSEYWDTLSNLAKSRYINAIVTLFKNL